MDLLSHFAGFMKIVPGIVMLPLSFYLGFKKIGTKATLSYTLTKQAHTAGSISSVTISNKKDKPIVLYDIYIKINNETIIEIKKFSPPVVIKGLETTVIEFEDVSSYSDGERDVALHSFFDSDNLLDFYSSTPDSCLKFKLQGISSPMAQAFKSNSPFVTPTRKEFKGIIYGRNIRWAITYKFNDTEKTSFINDGGILLYDWPFYHLIIEQKSIENANLIKDQILNSPLNSIITSFSIYDLSANTRNRYIPAATHSIDEKQV